MTAVFSFVSFNEGAGGRGQIKSDILLPAPKINPRIPAVKSTTDNYRFLPIGAGLELPESTGKYVLGLRIITQIDTPTDSKQVSKSIDWYRLVLKGIDEGLIRNRCHFVHVKVGVFRKGLAFLNIP